MVGIHPGVDADHVVPSPWTRAPPFRGMNQNRMDGYTLYIRRQREAISLAKALECRYYAPRSNGDDFEYGLVLFQSVNKYLPE